MRGLLGSCGIRNVQQCIFKRIDESGENHRVTRVESLVHKNKFSFDSRHADVHCFQPALGADQVYLVLEAHRLPGQPVNISHDPPGYVDHTKHALHQWKHPVRLAHYRVSGDPYGHGECPRLLIELDHPVEDSGPSGSGFVFGPADRAFNGLERGEPGGGRTVVGRCFELQPAPCIPAVQGNLDFKNRIIGQGQYVLTGRDILAGLHDTDFMRASKGALTVQRDRLVSAIERRAAAEARLLWASLICSG
jgi:hypothetical protein